MAINPHLCSFCNEQKPTVAIGLDGKIPTRIVKWKAKQHEQIDAWDRSTRYLCKHCILTQIPGARIGKYEVFAAGKKPISIPRSTIILFFKDGNPMNVNLDWVEKRYMVWLEEGLYEFIRIDAPKKSPRKRINKKETPLFGDLSGGYDTFAENQGHRSK